MEYVEGSSGAELLREQGHLPITEALAIVGHACRGLEFAHRNGVVHRDIKPGNLLRSNEGTTKVADFGIAKNLADESSITQVGSVLGTASYLAPEQASGDEAGPPADLYGLGVVAYQLLSGQLPYEAQSLTELAMKQQREAPPLLDEIVDGVTPQLALAIDRALALDPRDRFDDAETMRKAMMDGARGYGDAPTGATRVAGAPATSATRVATIEPATTRQPRAGDRRSSRASPATAPGAAGRAPAPAAARRSRRAQAPPRAPVRPAAAGGAVRRRRGDVAVIATSTSQTAVRLRTITATKAHSIVRQLQQLVNDNTK